MNGTHLTGLEGTNPLGVFAALGVQVAFASDSAPPRLWWSDDVTPHAVVEDGFSIDRIVNRALSIFAEWTRSPALNPVGPDGTPMKKADELKLAPPDIRAYIASTRGGGPGSTLSTALVAEGSLDNNGVAKPSSLYFTAGQMKFLSMVRRILAKTSREDIAAGLNGPWTYRSQLPSLMWDVADDRVYALTANNPAKEKKHSNPGPEALAILGLSMHPVFAGRSQTLTQGCSGTWKNGSYCWPLWRRPASPGAVSSLLAHAHDPHRDHRHLWFRSWGVFTVLRSPISRSGQGGYGTFRPPEVIWREVAAHVT